MTDQTHTQAAQQSSLDTIEPLIKNSLWVKIVAITTMLTGFLVSLSIIGALLGIPQVYAGWCLWGSLEQARLAKGGDEVAGKLAITKVVKYFKVFGIIMLTYVICMVLGIFTQGLALFALFG